MLSDSNKIQLADCDTGMEMPMYVCPGGNKYTPCVGSVWCSLEGTALTVQFHMDTHTGAAEHL